MLEKIIILQIKFSDIDIIKNKAIEDLNMIISIISGRII